MKVMSESFKSQKNYELRGDLGFSQGKGGGGEFQKKFEKLCRPF